MFFRFTLYLFTVYSYACNSGEAAGKRGWCEVDFGAICVGQQATLSGASSVLTNVTTPVVAFKQLLCHICAPKFCSFSLSYSGVEIIL